MRVYRLKTSAGTYNQEVISLESRPAGDYCVRIIGFDGAVNRVGYTLTLLTAGDRREANDTRATATDRYLAVAAIERRLAERRAAAEPLLIK